MKISFVFACAICTTALSGCALPHDLKTDDAVLVRQVVAEHCEIGELHTSDRSSSGRNAGTEVRYIRQGKISKRVNVTPFHYTSTIKIDRIFVHSIKDLSGGWSVADSSYEGQRENLYFNRTSGEFTCSTDEWRTVNADRDDTFEVSPLITSTAPKATPKP